MFSTHTNTVFWIISSTIWSDRSPQFATACTMLKLHYQWAISVRCDELKSLFKLPCLCNLRQYTSLACMFCLTITVHVKILLRTVSSKFPLNHLHMYSLRSVNTKGLIPATSPGDQVPSYELLIFIQKSSQEFKPVLIRGIIRTDKLSRSLSVQ